MKRFIISIFIFKLCWGYIPPASLEILNYQDNGDINTALRSLERSLNLLHHKLNLLSEIKISNNNSSDKLVLPVNCNGEATGLKTIIIPFVGLEPFYVACNANYGGNWTVIQRRVDDNMNFYRPWSDYKRGFGNLNGSFFIGLDKLYVMTTYEPYELLILMEDFDNGRKYAKYDSFVIGDETEGYALKKLGTFSGDAGDNLSDLISQKFSTYDKDNTISKSNCAESMRGAWWHRDCSFSNLNGLYLSGYNGAEKDGQGIEWHGFRGHNYSLKFVEMLIRPKTK